MVEDQLEWDNFSYDSGILKGFRRNSDLVGLISVSVYKMRLIILLIHILLQYLDFLRE